MLLESGMRIDPEKRDGNMSATQARIGRLLLCCLAIGGLIVAMMSRAQQSATNNQANLRSKKPMTTAIAPHGKEIATLAGGCFWCTEAIFTELKGVDKVEPGYAGGTLANPSYEDVCTGTTGHAESIQITFDPKVISFHDLLVVFLTTHDPTTLNRQGNDRGTQYRSAIFYHSEQQKEVAHRAIQEINAQKLYANKIVTEVTPFTNFYVAEDYHKNYFARNPDQGYCQIVIAPKVIKFREHFRDKLKK
jgi:peptide-methionine (S)-S-oxide reductase